MTLGTEHDCANTVLLVANRGEIALRVIRSARGLGIRTVAVFSQDDSASPHVAAADESVALDAAGPLAYLDRDALVAVAAGLRAAGRIVLVHPGYGFLSEDPAFAADCDRAGAVFVGPSAEVLRRCGDKTAARTLADSASVPVLPATSAASGIDEIVAFARGRAGIMIKAVAGGGGRGMREVRSCGPGAPIDPHAVAGAFRACAAEAEAGFGDDAVFAEEMFDDARHIEVQIVGFNRDGGGGAVLSLGDRDCSVQRRHQKLIETAPARDLPDHVRRTLHGWAAALGARVGYRGAGTVEFLVSGERIVFLEINPRLQVEHTVTEEVTGVDLVATQIRVALGAHHDALDLPDGIMARAAAPGSTGAPDVIGDPAPAFGTAIQARVNMETMNADGAAAPSAGRLDAFSPPTVGSRSGPRRAGRLIRPARRGGLRPRPGPERRNHLRGGRRHRSGRHPVMDPNAVADQNAHGDDAGSPPRSSLRRIFPVTVFGSSSATSTMCGTL